MSLPTSIRLLTCAVLLGLLLPVCNAQANSYNCGQNTFNDLNGVIVSPGNLNYYDNNQYCSYSIVASSLSTINFTFNQLGLEQQDSCVYDWIEFTCESDQISRPIRYCGYGYRAELSFKPCSRILVTFRSDGSVTGIGYSVSYEVKPIRCQGDCAPVSNDAGYNCNCDANQTPYSAPAYDQCPVGCNGLSSYCACSAAQTAPSTTTTTTTTTTTLPTTTTPVYYAYCGQRTFNGSAGVITSPNYPSYYDNNQLCSYYIEASSLSTIKFNFNAFGLEQQNDCVYDWIELTCESNQISRPIRYCGSGYRSELSFKPCSRVLVAFRSDGSVTSIGYSVSYAIEPIRCQGNCTPVSNGSGYNCNCDANQTPYTAPPYDQCPAGCFSSSGYCACSSPTSPYISNSTSTSNTTASPTNTTASPVNTTPSPANTTTSSFNNTFSLTNTTASNSGTCGQSTFSGPSGTITSPNYYPNYYENSQYCTYSVVASSLSTIKFNFNRLGLEENYGCTFDWIEFTCESNSIGQPIRYCGSGDRAELIFIPCSRVLATFRTDGSVTGIGFSVSYDIEPISNANQTSSTAPPYGQCPNGCYSSSNYCACTLPYNSNSTSTSNTTWSPANYTASPANTTTSPFFYTFPPTNTTGSNSATCGQSTFSGSSGNITSPNLYPNYYENSQYCTYSVVASSLSTIKFTFNRLGLEQHPTCAYDWIEFTCESNSVRQPIRYCGSGDRAEFSFKPCSRISMTFRTDGSVTGIGFSVSYDIEPIRCQGACDPVSNGSTYNCNCDANQTPYTAPPYDQCPAGCSSSSGFCACSSSADIPRSNDTTTTFPWDNPGNATDNPNPSTTPPRSNGTTPRPVTVNAGNSSGNVTQTTTRRPSNTTATPPRPVTLNAQNSSGNVTTRGPSYPTTPRPATVRAQNSSAGNVAQTTTRRPANATTRLA